MYKKFLLSVLAMIVGFFTVSAENVMIDVDKAENVKVYTYQKGNVSLMDGMNRITDLTSAEDPLVIEPANGATIVSVTKNETETVHPSGDGIYRVGIENMMLKIVTSGGGSGPVVSEVGFTLSSMGNPGSFYAKIGDTDVTIGTQMKVAPGTEVTVYPAEGYAIDKVADLYGTQVGSINADGTYTFAVGSEDSNWYYVYTKVSGLTFTIEPDYAPNVLVMLNAKPDGSTDTYKYVQLNANGATKVVTTKDMEPMLIQGDNGAEVTSVTRNGEPVQFMSGGWITGYASEFEEGDVFVITTKGKTVDFTFSAAADNAPLESYIFRLADGSTIDLSGMEQRVQLPLGTKVFIEGRPGTDYKYVIAKDFSSDMREWIRVVENGTATVYGTRSTGVTVNVDNATRVSVKQANGRGDALTLIDGENKFELKDLQNSLAITPAEGNQIVSVSLNGIGIEPNRSGIYLATVEEGSYLDIKSRKIPGDVAVSFALNEGADISWLKATLNDEPCELTASMTVKAGSVYTLVPTLGYRIDTVTTSTPGCNVVKDAETGAYTLTVGDQAEAAMFSVIVNEITAEQGNALVIIKTESPFLNFLERTPEGTTVQKATTDKVNEFKIGNNLYIYTFTSGVYIKSVTVNGKELPDAKNQRNYSLPITENCTIEVTTYQKVDVATVNSINDIAHIEIGDLLIVDADGNTVHHLECEVGQTITFRAKATVGYLLQRIEKFYPEPVTTIDGFTYTITQEDAEMGMIQFRGVFVPDPGHPTYTIRTSPAYELDSEGNPIGQSGYIYVYLGEGDPTGLDNCVTEYTAEVGSKVRLVCFSREDYHLKSFCLSEGYPNSTFPGSYYTVNADDANAEGVIWITGVMEKNEPSGIGGTAADGSMAYDRATSTLATTTAARLFNAAGAAVISVEAGSTNLSHLPAGVYIAMTADGQTLKFVK